MPKGHLTFYQGLPTRRGSGQVLNAILESSVLPSRQFDHSSNASSRAPYMAAVINVARIVTPARTRTPPAPMSPTSELFAHTRLRAARNTLPDRQNGTKTATPAPCRWNRTLGMALRERITTMSAVIELPRLTHQSKQNHVSACVTGGGKNLLPIINSAIRILCPFESHTVSSLYLKYPRIRAATFCLVPRIPYPLSRTNVFNSNVCMYTTVCKTKGDYYWPQHLACPAYPTEKKRLQIHSRLLNKW